MKKDIAMMMIGAGMVLAYQKYGNTVKKEMTKMYNKMMKKSKDTLEDMM